MVTTSVGIGCGHASQGRCRLVVGALMFALVLAVPACGSSSSTTTSTTSVSHPTTKFVLHAGLAFGAFHRWIYKPLKAGDFSHPLSHKLTVIKAAAAGAFVYHEVKLALADARASPTLSHLVAPITVLQGRISRIASGLKSGHVDSASIFSANGTIGSIRSSAASAGQPITEQVPSGL